MGNIQYQILGNFSLVFTKFSFWEEDWKIDCNSGQFSDSLKFS